jgi:hypothetical protein
VLKGIWQFLDRPILLHKLPDISLRVTCCIILHNILMADRVMEDCRATYNPPYSLAATVEAVTQPHDLNQVQQLDSTETTGAGGIGVGRCTCRSTAKGASRCRGAPKIACCTTESVW